MSERDLKDTQPEQLMEEARKAVAEARKEGVQHGYIPVAFLDALATALSECREALRDVLALQPGTWQGEDYFTVKIPAELVQRISALAAQPPSEASETPNYETCFCPWTPERGRVPSASCQIKTHRHEAGERSGND